MIREEKHKMGKFKSLGIFGGVILLALGVVFIVFSEQVTEIMGMLIGLGILFIGVARLLQALSHSPAEVVTHKTGRVILSGIMICIGAYLLINGKVAISFVGVIIGIVAFAAAVDRFVVANERRKMGLPRGLTIISGVIHILFGLLMIYAAVQVVNMLVIFSGIYLLVAGIMMIISVVYKRDLMKPVDDAIREAVAEEQAFEQKQAAAEEKQDTGDN